MHSPFSPEQLICNFVLLLFSLTDLSSLKARVIYVLHILQNLQSLAESRCSTNVCHLPMRKPVRVCLFLCFESYSSEMSVKYPGTVIRCKTLFSGRNNYKVICYVFTQVTGVHTSSWSKTQVGRADSLVSAVSNQFLCV